jgi:hypothetical protein
MELTFELDAAREVMYEELTEQFAEEPIKKDLQEAVEKRLTGVYDKRGELQEQQQRQ